MIMANSRIKDLSERTTLASGDYLATDNNSGTRKVDASKILTPISNAQGTADNVATKVSNSGDAFSSSKGYSVGELCIYNNKVYRCKTSYSTGASWSSRSSYFDQVTLTDAVSDLNNALSNKSLKLLWTNNSPTSSFSTQNVDLQTTDFDYLVIFYNINTQEERYLSTTVLKNTKSQLEAINTVSGGSRNMIRNLSNENPSDTRNIVSFGNATESTGASSSTTNNNDLIPYKIYGGKF